MMQSTGAGLLATGFFFNSVLWAYSCIYILCRSGLLVFTVKLVYFPGHHLNVQNTTTSILLQHPSYSWPLCSQLMQSGSFVLGHPQLMKWQYIHFTSIHSAYRRLMHHYHGCFLKSRVRYKALELMRTTPLETTGCAQGFLHFMAG